MSGKPVGPALGYKKTDPLYIVCVHRPVLLVRMARRKRKETGDARYYAPMEKTKLPLAKRVQNVLGRPTSMLINEPMLLAITIYMSVRKPPASSNKP